MRQDGACVICQQLVREVNSHDRALSPPCCLSLSFSLTTPHYTGGVSAASVVKAMARARFSASVLADTSERLISLSALPALNSAQSGPQTFMPVTSKSIQRCTTNTFLVVWSRLKHLNNYCLDWLVMKFCTDIDDLQRMDPDVHICGSKWNVPTAIGWITIKSGTIKLYLD